VSVVQEAVEDGVGRDYPSNAIGELGAKIASTPFASPKMPVAMSPAPRCR
jgi:hypothetical protein